MTGSSPPPDACRFPFSHCDSWIPAAWPCPWRILNCSANTHERTRLVRLHSGHGAHGGSQRSTRREVRTLPGHIRRTRVTPLSASDTARGAISTDIPECCARVLVIQAARGCYRASEADPGHGSAHLLVPTCGPRFSRPRLQTHGPVASPQSERRSALRGHAAASTDGHLSHDADRFASTRVRRAAAARDVRSAGTASPVPKYISSGVWPRNAECGSTRLCSST
jgi:hypothetical protein